MLGWFSIFMDDGVIHTKRWSDETKEQHIARHHRYVHEIFDILAENDLYIKLEKCAFEQEEIEYLGVIVGRGQLCIDPKKLHVSWQPIIFSASSHVHSSHVHSHMLHHVVSHLTGHMTHHVIHHMIFQHNISHVTWHHGLEGSRKVWNDDSELLLIYSSISHPMISCAASWLILWCHVQLQQVINSTHSVIMANYSSRRTQVQTVARSIYTL